MNTPLPKLLRCPFCGADNSRVALYNQPAVECLECGAFGPNAQRLHRDQDNLEECKAEAVLYWNSRAAISSAENAAPDTACCQPESEIGDAPPCPI